MEATVRYFNDWLQASKIVIPGNAVYKGKLCTSVLSYFWPKCLITFCSEWR